MPIVIIACLLLEYMFDAIAISSVVGLHRKSEDDEWAFINMCAGTFLGGMMIVLNSVLGHGVYPFWVHFPVLIPVFRIAYMCITNK